MNIALWIVQGLLALAFAGAGFMKVSQPKEKLQPTMAYVEDLSAGTVKLIGTAELLAALGLILPWLTGIASVLTPLAASGLVLLMLLAVATHVRRKEYPAILFNVILGGLALFVALGRF
jgi:uncharacterized membrane protein YphA (DoxX/SURF4 family)